MTPAWLFHALPVAMAGMTQASPLLKVSEKKHPASQTSQQRKVMINAITYDIKR
jgi:hypothetical protein